MKTMRDDLWDVQYNITYDGNYKHFKEALKEHDYFDEWGEVQVWFKIPIDGILYGAELNFACDAGEDETAIYLMREHGEAVETDTAVMESFEGSKVLMDFELIQFMKEFVYKIVSDDMQCIATMSFVNDAEKMLDFSTLSKDEFLKSYSYIKESEYNATVDYIKFLNAIGKEN